MVKRCLYFLLLVLSTAAALFSLVAMVMMTVGAILAYRDGIPNRWEYLYDSILYFLFLALFVLVTSKLLSMMRNLRCDASQQGDSETGPPDSRL